VAAAWAELAGEDAAKAYAAVWALANAPDDAVPFLRGRLRPVSGPPDNQVRALIGKLDSPGFAAREEAEKELRELGDAVVPALRVALQAKPSGEQVARLERLLAAATPTPPPPGPLLQQLRAVAILEQAGTAESQAIMKELAGGLAGTRLTSEAAEALGRLSQRKAGR
jgi:hypothetical protein